MPDSASHFLLKEDTTTQPISWINLDAAVAIATPLHQASSTEQAEDKTDILGIYFRINASIFSAILMVTLPILRRTAR